MAIVSVAIIMNFHLKSEPTTVGKYVSHFIQGRNTSGISCSTVPGGGEIPIPYHNHVHCMI